MRRCIASQGSALRQRETTFHSKLTHQNVCRCAAVHTRFQKKKKKRRISGNFIGTRPKAGKVSRYSIASLLANMRRCEQRPKIVRPFCCAKVAVSWISQLHNWSARYRHQQQSTCPSSYKSVKYGCAHILSFTYTTTLPTRKCTRLPHTIPM